MTNMNKVSEKLQNKEFTFLKDDETFKFSCDMCGKCCFGRNDILVNPYDVYKIAKELKTTTDDIINKFCFVTLGGNSKMPIVGIEFTKISKDMNVCPFLAPMDKNNLNLLGCGIHDSKPSVCAIYPLGRAIQQGIDDNSEMKVEYFDQHIKCCDLPQKDHTLKDWKKDFNLELSEKEFIKYSKYLIDSMKTIDFVAFEKHDVVTNNTKQMMYNAIIGTLYSHLEKASDIHEELEKRYAKALEALKITVDGAKLMGIEGLEPKIKN